MKNRPYLSPHTFTETQILLFNLLHFCLQNKKSKKIYKKLTTAIKTISSPSQSQKTEKLCENRQEFRKEHTKSVKNDAKMTIAEI